jgi:hypothetical protein
MRRTNFTQEALMRKHLAGPLSFFVFALAAAGCGGGSSSGTKFACTNGSGTSQTCFEIFASSAQAGGVDQAKMDCTNGGGVASDTCSHVGADGACKTDLSGNGVTASLTSWYYSGDATTKADEMSACTGNGDTWISP